ncbi:hypothetical protein A3K78_06535 [Candidatus Bathyarchaeota archaeon RBG_13_52_12]|nr:MAG: hypothetical protein A3K69_03850 [Candidatus Bathyarchaeota archaeon RBG_16_57_9]OGD56750.1 MAG: hypothetical protein A3K78_06535 [Candidatus Bathyarchaeota archaeon RBG_13_52_12]
MIGISTASYVTLSLFTDSLIEEQNAYTKYNLGYITLYQDEPMFFGDKVFTCYSSYPFSDQDAYDILQEEGVETVYKISIVKIPYRNGVIGLIGIESGAEESAMLPYANIQEGSYLNPAYTDEAIVNIGLATAYVLDDKVSLEIKGSEHTFRIVGVYDSLLPKQMDPEHAVAVDLETYWGLLDTPPSDRRYSSLLISSIEPEQGETLARNLRERYSNKTGLYVSYQYALAKYTIDLLHSASNFYNTLNVILLVTAAGSILLVRLIDMLERRKEIGLLTVLGWKERDIVIYMLVQTCLVSFSGFLLGATLLVIGGENVTRLLVSQELSQLAYIRLGSIGEYLLPMLLLPLSFSTLAFLAAYVFYKRHTPLSMMRDT